MRQGFSLVELSIVLVILGLLTGGILAGQSLIRAAETRAVTTEYSRWVSATQTFRDKYLALPGDMTGATRFWTRQVNQAWCVTNSSAAVSTPGACDGDGDGTIEDAAAASQSGERFQYWKELANAGLIEGNYTGLADTAAFNAHTAGLNCAASRVNAAGWAVYTHGNIAGTAGTTFGMDYGTTLIIAGYNNSTTSLILRPEEAWNIDTKLDDGKPGRGKVIGNYISTCTDSGSAAGSQNLLDSSYLLTSTSMGCTLIFRQQF